MERRIFLKRLGVVIGGLALAEAVPLGRVYSFPSKIVRISDYEWRAHGRHWKAESLSFHPDAFAMAMNFPERYDLVSLGGEVGRIGIIEIDEERNVLNHTG